MTVEICDVGCRGRLDLKFVERNGRTVISESYCEVPFKITKLFDSRNSNIAHLILMQCTAGVFGGDSLDCNIHVGRGARVRITQQSATKVHPSAGRLASQSMRIHIEPHAELVFDCEPIIPFAESRLSQKTCIEVSAGSRLVFWESLMAGRIGRNELWQFSELAFETRLELAGRVLFLDRFGLLPRRQTLTTAWVAGNATYVGTGLYFGSDGAGIAESLNHKIPDSGIDVLTPNLTVARVVSTSGPEFHRSRAAFMHSSLRSTCED